MFNIFRCQFYPVILRIRSLSTTKVIEQVFMKTNAKLLCEARPNLSSLIQNRSLTSMDLPQITTIDYEQLKEFINENKALIIDVRTKEELATTGVIPKSFNIPLDELSDALEMTSDEFLKTYDFPKPNKDQNIVFSCAKGIRSSHACHHFVHLGYEKIFNYSEGWYGWASHL